MADVGAAELEALETRGREGPRQTSLRLFIPAKRVHSRHLRSAMWSGSRARCTHCLRPPRGATLTKGLTQSQIMDENLEERLSRSQSSGERLKTDGLPGLLEKLNELSLAGQRESSMARSLYYVARDISLTILCAVSYDSNSWSTQHDSKPQATLNYTIRIRRM